MKKQRKNIALCLVFLLVWTFGGCGKASAEGTDYSSPENWAVYAEGEGDADLFFVCPTVDLGLAGNLNMSLEDMETKSSFLGASQMELGIYNENAVVYAPYYRQVTFPVYALEEAEAAPYFNLAYSDVRTAFETYLKQADTNRPLILAGFSQGADMVIRLVKEFGKDSVFASRLVAAYAIGWRLTGDDVEAYPWLVPASCEDDTGCIVTFNSEAEGITGSLLVPEGTHTFSINPLNWKTDSTPAAAEENLGACFTDYSGSVTSEIPALTGAFIDHQRGTLICTEINPADYSNVLFPDGVYHLYDYQFFYRNLQANVAVRLRTWFQNNS